MLVIKLLKLMFLTTYEIFVIFTQANLQYILNKFKWKFTCPMITVSLYNSLVCGSDGSALALLDHVAALKISTEKIE